MESKLSCDGPKGCGIVIPIPLPQSWEDMASHIGHSCPKCGADMLTEASAKAGWEMLETLLPKLSALKALGLIRSLEPGEQPKAGEAVITGTLATTPEGSVRLKNLTYSEG